MLLWTTAAFAAPLAPSTLPGPGIEVSGYGGSQRAWLRQSDCPGNACDALRVDGLLGVEAGVNVWKSVGLYAHGAHVKETVDAATYAGAGYAVGGGLRAALPLGPYWGVHLWGGVEQQLTGIDDLSERLTAWSVDGGAALRGGRQDEGFQGWIGLDLVPWSTNAAQVLDGDLSLELHARLPLTATGGLMWISEPLAGPWDQRTRLGAGMTGSAGYDTGLQGFVSFLY
jgi:hypothetical protein